MNIQSNEIHIWRIDFPPQMAHVTELTTLLSTEEKLRADRFHFEIHRQRFIIAHARLRQILSYYVNEAPEAIQFFYSSHQKPYIQSTQHYTFNLSHSHDMALIAVATHADIGIDIEKIDEDTDITAIAKRFFNEQENKNLLLLDHHKQLSVFFQLWSRKEAVLKASGKGFSIPLHSVITTLEKQECITVDSKKWWVMPIEIDANYAAAVASNQSIAKITQYHFDDFINSLSY